MPYNPQFAPAATRQRGQAALIIVLLLLGVAAAVVIYALSTPAKLSIERDKITAAVLAQARDALIGRAASDNTRPGSLPCPDVNNDGALTLGIDYGGGGICTATIGRLPWRTLGLPDLRDSNGERLWYAVSPNFQDASGVTINSDTPGQLTVTGVANNVIAIVFSPGAAVGSQVRDTPNENNVENFLECGNGDGDTTYVTSAINCSFNDKLMPITRDALFPAVEMRVARELRLSLQNYYAANGFYPLAAQFPNNTSTSGTYRGYVPTATTACLLAPDLSPYLPKYVSPANQGWFIANDWQRHMVYAVAPRCTPKINVIPLNIGILTPPPPCAYACINLVVIWACLFPQNIDASYNNCGNTVDGTPAGSWLTVSGVGNVHSIVLPASYQLNAQARPCNSIVDCLETVGTNTENTDNTDNYVYVKPVRSSTNNDNLIVVSP